MKLSINYIILLLSFLMISGCDKPVPTELLQDETDPLNIEIIAKDSDDEYYLADSSGVIVDDLNRFANIISVSGIKITTDAGTTNTSYAQAIFFDRSRPFHRGERHLTYYTRALGDVQFNNVPAIIIPYRIRYRDGSTIKEETLGPRHVLNSIFPGQVFNYEYNSSVSFNIDFFQVFGGGSAGFNIPTPSEIAGNVSLKGKRENKTLEAVLRWNGKNHRKFEIIIGASPGSEKIFPFFRLRTNDDGELIIPSELINNIPLRFNKLIFILVRKIDSGYSGGNHNLYVLSQSIHSLIVNIP